MSGRLAAPRAALPLLAVWLVPACGSDNSSAARESPADVVTDAAGPEAEPDTSDAPVAQAGCEDCLVFVHGQLFDGSDTRPGTLVVRGDRIESVHFEPVEVVAGRIVDIEGSTLLPGFIDLHVHSPGAAGPYGYYAPTFQTDANLRSMLRNGVTSFLDLGTNAALSFALRNRIREGRLMGPRMFAAGPMLTATGGHPCYAGTPPSDACRFVDDTAEGSSAVQGLLPYGPDVIKVIIESGSEGRPLPEIPADGLLAASQAAQAAGLTVFAHVNETQDVVKAMDAGIRVIAHMPVADRLPAEVLQRMVDEQVTVVPTAEVYDELARIATDDLDLEGLEEEVPAEVLEALRYPSYMEPQQTAAHAAFYGNWRENLMFNLAACREAGVRIAAGTDAGNPATFYGVGLLRELALYVKAGYTPAQALAAGTRDAAALLGASDLGRLEAGALADLVVVAGDPADDIALVRSVQRVWLGGVEVDRPAMSQSQSASLVVEPVAGLQKGEACLHEGECADDLICASDAVCRPFCSTSVLCEQGSVCVAESTTSWDGYCLESDGCAPVTQDCENGASCIWVGNGVTLCWYTGEGTAGEPCSDFGTCARGYQCEYASNVCRELCDPNAEENTCDDAAQECIDRSPVAGLSVGECK